MNYSEKAEVLIEAIPYILKFRGKIFVLKIGGTLIENEEVIGQIAKDIVMLSLVSIKVIVVCGGGKEISDVMKKFGMEPKFYNGLRITDEKTMEIVEMVLAGNLRGRIVSRICSEGGKAIGLTGRDFNFLIAEKIDKLGMVGRIVNVNKEPMLKLLDMELIPVISPITIVQNPDGTYTALNTNADEVASKIALSLEAEKLIFLTDQPGVLDKDGKVIQTIKIDKIPESIAGGMLPKIESAMEVAKTGKKVHILSGLQKHSILLEIFTKEGVGTEIVS